MSPRALSIRAFESQDAPAVVAVVRAVFDEYGFTWEEGGYCADLYDPQAHYIEPGGWFWVLENENGEIVGCVGLSLYDDTAEVHRMYIYADARGQGGGRLLMDTCIHQAITAGATTMRAWSDVKLDRAHALYHRFGFERDGERICNDPDQSREFGFIRSLP